MVRISKGQRTGIYVGASLALVGSLVVRELIDYKKIKDVYYIPSITSNIVIAGSGILLGVAIASPAKINPM
jgi:hypothetical protein